MILALDWPVFRLTGPDRKKFLNGLVSNDVLKLAPKAGMTACLLTPKGMLRSYFLLYDAGDSLLVLCPKETAGHFAETMNKMIMLSESKCEDASAELRCVLTAGEAVESAVALVPWPRLSPESSVAVLKKGAGPIPTMDAEAFEVWRVERALPLYGVDMGEDTIPLEARLEDAISFDKGCYMGQETISRVHNLGHLNKILVQLKVTAAEPPARGSAVLDSSGKELGKLTSAAVSPKAGGILALATIRLEAAKPGTVVGVRAERGSHRAEVVDLR
jgi:folate-binding protein YgfZ